MEQSQLRFIAATIEVLQTAITKHSVSHSLTLAPVWQHEPQDQCKVFMKTANVFRRIAHLLCREHRVFKLNMIRKCKNYNHRVPSYASRYSKLVETRTFYFQLPHKVTFYAPTCFAM